MYVRGALSHLTTPQARRLVVLTMGSVFSAAPMMQLLPGNHGFVKDDSFLLNIKMMQRLLRPENEG